MREKVGKSRNTALFPMICGSGGSKSRLAKAAGAEPAGQMRDEKVHAVCTKQTIVGPLLEVAMSKKCTPFLARSTFRSQNVQNTPGSDHFWKLRCRTSARRCGAKHISKSKCTKHHMFAPLLEVQMSKKCTPLWREAHFQVQNVQNTTCSRHFWRFRCRKSAQPLWREAHFQVKMFKTLGVRTTFGGSDVASLQYTTLQDNPKLTLNHVPCMVSICKQPQLAILERVPHKTLHINICS